eukprot:CAMPEP_0196759780 /NCGR_PEP_ID=MMETSP1091-20130531/104875_1 /TAXON_ID=302021 /ORGANISM="Rhodomonas sp., Strain CCMP768" /LENGTH=328 /DNA_ID=CAMNT_0042108639 /DNA_START=160 /DNA_END=1147 /DNA_ORIENTATION=+
MYCMQSEEMPQISFLLLHDITEHAGALGGLASSLFEHCRSEGIACSVFAVDLPGHGHTGMEATSGEFNMTGMVELVWEAAEWIKAETKESAVVTVGIGIGGEVAFQASSGSEAITATVANGLLLSNEVRGRISASSGSEAITATVANGLLLSNEVHFREQVELLKGWVGDALELLLHGQRVFLPSLISFWRLYDKISCDEHSAVACEWNHDSEGYEEHMADPLSTWYTSLSSLRSLFHHPPLTSAENSSKPVLVLAGGRDQAIPLSHVRACFHRLAGHKFLRFDSRAGHQLHRQLTEDTSRVVVGWSRAVLDGTLGELAVESPQLILG